MENNKVVLADGTTLMDITNTTAVASDVASGKHFYNAAGVYTEGTAVGTSVAIVSEHANSVGGVDIDISSATENPLPYTDTLDAGGGTIRSITADVVLKLQSKQATPTTSVQTVLPDTGYDGLSEVIVKASGGGISLQSKTATPTTVSQTITADANYDALSSVTVEPIPPEYIVPTGALSISQNGTYDVAAYEDAIVNVQSGAPTLQTKSATPTESAQTITPDSGYDGLSSVSVGAISSTYVGTGVTRRSSTDLTATGATVTAPAGYYQSSASKTIPNATTLYGEFAGINANGDVSFDAEVDIGGYIGSGTYRITDSGAITVRGVNDLSVSADTVTAPAGYYPQSVGTTVANGTAGTPTATKGSVSNHSVSVTPSVTNTTGYITGGTKTGTAATVSASELVSGTLSITENGTGIDVTNYQYVDVDVSGGGGGVETKTITNSSASNTSISFSGLNGTPTMFEVRCTQQLTRSSSSSYYYVVNIRYNGTNTKGNYWRMSNGTYYNDTSHYSYTYSNGTLTVTSSGSRSAAGGSFYNGEYELTYAY